MPPVSLYKTLLAVGLTCLLSGFLESSLYRVQAFEFKSPKRGLPGRRIGAGTRAFQPPGGAAESIRAVPSPEFGSPSRGLPGRRTGAGSRSPSAGPCLPDPTKNLVALLPDTNLGLTTTAYPRFFWSIPQNNASGVEFSLYAVDAQKNNRQLLYQTTFSISGESAIASLELPQTANLPPLAANQDYRWTLALVCNPDDRAQDITVEGWVQRNTPSNALNQQLQKAAPRDRPAIYAQNGFWFDTLATLAEQRCLRPQDPTVIKNWEGVLQSVKLGAIAKQPLISTCTSANP